MTAGLATKVVGQGLVNRRTDRRPGYTACGAAEQATEDRTSDGAQRITVALCVRNRARGTLDSTGDAADGSGRGLCASSSNDERGMTTGA